MEKTPVVTKEFIKKYIHNGNYYRGGCIRAFAKKNHLTIKEATVIIDDFTKQNQQLIDEMTKNSLTPHHHYLLVLIIEIIIGIYFITQNYHYKSLFRIIGLGITIGFLFFIFTIFFWGFWDMFTGKITYQPTVSKQPNINQKKKYGANHCPKCGSTNIYLYDDAPGGYDYIEPGCMNPNHYKDAKYFTSVQHFKDDIMDPMYNYQRIEIKRKKKVTSKSKVTAALLTGGMSIPFTRGIKKKVSSEWACRDCHYHWYKK